MAPAAVRLLNMQTWDAELVPVAIAAMIVAIAYNPQLRADGHLHDLAR